MGIIGKIGNVKIDNIGQIEKLKTPKAKPKMERLGKIGNVKAGRIGQIDNIQQRVNRPPDTMPTSRIRTHCC